VEIGSGSSGSWVVGKGRWQGRSGYAPPFASVEAEFTPAKFWVVFAGLTHRKVTVEGRNLRALYDRLNYHCLRRIRQADRDFEDDGKPVVTKIKVKDVTPTAE
jgi:hypothetical protein